MGDASPPGLRKTDVENNMGFMKKIIRNVLV